MANRIELFVDVDPTGRGAAAIRSIRAEIGNVSRGTKDVGEQGSLLGSIFAGNALYNYFKQGTDAAIAFGKESVKAYAELTQDQRFLNSQIAETGVNYDLANKKVDEFDRRLTLTRSNAEKLYAVTLQFTKEVGNVGRADEFINKLSDILVSHGLSPEQQADITRSLLAGRATELGKVLGQNVASIEKEAAKAGGFANFANLDDATKKLLLFNEIMQKGEQYTGATDARLKDADGTLGAISAAFDRAKESAGRFLLEESLVGDLIRRLLGISPEEFIESKLAAASKRAEDAARRHYDELKRVGDLAHLQAQLARDPSRKFESPEFFVASQNLSPDAEERIREQARQAAEAARDEVAKLRKGEGDRAAGEALARLAGQDSKGIVQYDPEGKEDKQRQKAAEDARRAAEQANDVRAAEAFGRTLSEAEIRGRLDEYDRLASEQTGAFIRQYEQLFKDKHLDVVTTIFAERQFNTIKGIFNPEKREEIAKGLRELFQKFEREAATYLKGVRTAAEGLFSTLASRYAGDQNNPFVKIFTEADENARKLEKTFGVLGDRVVAELKEVEGAYYRQLTLAAQLDASLRASDLNRKAAQIQSLRPGEQSAQEERAISLIERRLDVVKTTADINAKLYSISKGLGAGGLQEGVDKRREFELGRELNELQKMLKGFSGPKGTDIEGRSRVYQAITDIFEQLSPTTQQKISKGGYGGRDLFLEAYSGLRATGEERVRREIEQGRYLDEQLNDAREDIDKINRARRSGLESGEADTRLLRRLEQLPENALTPDLRRAGFEAYTREAERQGRLQTAAIEATKKARESTDKLTTATDNLAKAIQDPRQRKLLVEILNRSKADVRDNLYGSLDPLPANPGEREDPFN